MSPLFPDIVQCLSIQVLEIKKSELSICAKEHAIIPELRLTYAVVYLYLVNYGRSRPEEVNGAISGFLSDCHDRNPLIRGLAIRTMSSIPLPPIIQALADPLSHALQDQDPYVRKTAALASVTLRLLPWPPAF